MSLCGDGICLHFNRATLYTRYMLLSCVRPSVRLSHAGNAPKQLNVRSCKQGHRIFMDSSLLMPKSRRNSDWLTPNGSAKQRWGRFRSVIFDQYLAISQKRCKTGTQLLWKANRNSYALYQIALFPVTSNYPKPPHFRHFVSPIISTWWVEIQTSKLVDNLIVASARTWMANHL